MPKKTKPAAKKAPLAKAAKKAPPAAAQDDGEKVRPGRQAIPLDFRAGSTWLRTSR